MDILNINKYLLSTVIIIHCFIGCKEQSKIKPVILNEFDYLYSLPNKTETEVSNSKIFVIQKGVKIDSGKFIISSSQPITASIKFYDGKKSVNKEDTIKIDMGTSKHLITEIEDKPVKRKKGLSPFSSSSKPTIVTFKIDGKVYNESETLIIQ